MEQNGLHFFEHDIMAPFAHQEFDIITNLFTSFGYFDLELMDVKALTALRETLKINGVLVQDYLNIHLVQEDQKWNSLERDGYLFRTKKSIENGFVKKRIEVIDQGQKHSFQEQVRLFSLNDFKRLTKIAGLEMVEVFGDYELNSFDPLTSPRLIMISKPAE